MNYLKKVLKKCHKGIVSWAIISEGQTGDLSRMGDRAPCRGQRVIC